MKGGLHTCKENAQISQNFHGDLNLRGVLMLTLFLDFMYQIIKTDDFLGISVLDTFVLFLNHCFHQQELVYQHVEKLS